jgi:hypothetical protein
MYDIAAKREQAVRARRLARSVSDSLARLRLVAFADELDAQAAALESPHPPPQPRAVPDKDGGKKD